MKQIRLPFSKYLPGFSAFLVLLMALFILLKSSAIYQGWGGDYAGYISQARAVVEGQPQKESYYIYNPRIPYLAPPAYPMGFSLTLAPLYALYGLDMLVFVKFTNFTWWLVGVILFFFLRRHFSVAVALTASIFLLFNPYYFFEKNAVLPDYLFTFLLFSALYWYCYRDHSRWQNALICGLLTGAACITRANGILLLPVFALDLAWEHGAGWIRLRRLRLNKPEILFLGLLALTATLVYVLIAMIVFPGPKSGSYFDQLGINPMGWKEYRANLESSLRHVLHFFQLEPKMTFWQFDNPDVAVRVGGAMAAGMAFFGMVAARNERADRVLLFFLTALMVLLSIWPMTQGYRYLLPAFPILIYFMLKGISALQVKGRFPNALKWLIIPLLLFGAYERLDQTMYRRSQVEEIGSPEHPINIKAFHFVRDSVPADARVAANHPLILGLHGRHKSFKWSKAGTPEQIRDEFKEYGIEYLLINDWVTEGEPVLKSYIAHPEFGPKEIWRNERNMLYKIH